jgi:peptide/nickel transport system permease protein
VADSRSLALQRAAAGPDAGLAAWRSASIRLVRSPRGLAGVILTGLVLLVAILAPLIAAFPPDQQDLLGRLRPPAWLPNGVPDHPLGTDQLGRDLFSRIVHGSRTSLMVAGAAILLAGLVGVTLGLVAGYYGGHVDNAVMRLVDLQLAFPALLLAIIVMAILRPSMQSVILVLVVTGWAVHGRMVRGQVLSLREREFVQAARVIGCPQIRIMRRHILPNLVPLITVVGTIQMAQFILAESALSFLGLGILPPTPSWGSIISEGRDYIYTAWWIETFPGLAIVVTVSGIGLLGDWLRDYLDPRLRI